MSKNYAEVEDLLTDESFLAWHFRADSLSIRQWEEWIAADPLHSARAAQAVEFLQTLRFDEKKLTTGQLSQAESRLLKKILDAEYKSGQPKQDDQPHQDDRPRRLPVISSRRWWMVAASILLLVAGAYGIGEMLTRSAPELHTTYGEVKESHLPDGSSVVVNADSRLVFSKGWKDGKDREVWLTGEAFFHVAKTPMKSRFIVHVNHFDIIVTGTQFNVVNRQDKANVMLKEGSVVLHTEEGKELKMVPGDFVEYRSSLEKKIVRNDSILAWKEHKLIFDGTPLRDLITIIRENYGVTVTTSGADLEEKKLYGIMPNDNLDVLLLALQSTGDFEIVHEGNGILIKEHQ
ncbi:MAG TPA: FecR domain-containing protein [Puia sp.]|jgi:ferric-dicitrate binding protein FerR (iron transport regulator)|nr:FecR domain-containing protein [Puia sp.]